MVHMFLTWILIILQQMVRIYDIPDDTFESDEDSSDDEDDETDSDESD